MHVILETWIQGSNKTLLMIWMFFSLNIDQVPRWANYHRWLLLFYISHRKLVVTVGQEILRYSLSDCESYFQSSAVVYLTEINENNMYLFVYFHFIAIWNRLKSRNILLKTIYRYAQRKENTMITWGQYKNRKLFFYCETKSCHDVEFNDCFYFVVFNCYCWWSMSFWISWKRCHWYNNTRTYRWNSSVCASKTSQCISN